MLVSEWQPITMTFIRAEIRRWKYGAIGIGILGLIRQGFCLVSVSSKVVIDLNLFRIKQSVRITGIVIAVNIIVSK